MALRKLLDAVTASTNGTAVGWNGGRGTFLVTGGFGSGTCTLQLSADDGTTWTAVGTSTTLTAAGVANFDLPAGFTLRAVLSGATGATLTAWLAGP